MNLSVKVGETAFRNPIILASGTCGFGRELTEYIDFSTIGGLSSKGLTVRPRDGNPGCRTAETPSGMLNSVGLQNPGIEYFLRHELDFMRSLNTRVIINAAGHSTEDYVRMVEILDDVSDKIDVIELNLSCPNIKEGCMSVGTDQKQIHSLVSDLRKRTHLPLWVKLTPNVTSVSEMAIAAETAGADAIVLINTILGMKIDIHTRRPVLYNNTGGLSGPAIKPVAVRMIAECYQAVSVPIVGLGGVSSADDILEFMIAGAAAVQIGTATLVHPGISQKMVQDLTQLADENNIENIAEYTGTLRYW